MSMWFVQLLVSQSLAAAPVCTAWGEPALLAECLDCPRIDESSGVVPARNRPGVWFTHNDAGGDAELYAFDASGVHLETHSVLGGGFRDWEDIASGPCPTDVEAETCVYIGDVGDNSESREEIDIWVVAEPVAGETAEVVASWRLRYPVRPHDCEAIVVHPCTGRVYLITKERSGEPTVFRVPETPTGPDRAVDLELVATMPITWFGDSGLVTGADWSERGDQLALHTYDGGWYWPTDPAHPEAHWSTAPLPLPVDTEGQGEAIAFHPDGGILTTTERIPMRITYVPCDGTVDPSECPPPEPEDTGAPVDTGTPDDTACCPDTATDTAEEIVPGTQDSTAPVAEDPDSAVPAATAAAAPTKDECGCASGSSAWIAAWCLLGLVRRREAQRT